MSGEKHVTLRESEYNRIMATVRTVDNEKGRNARLQSQMEEARREAERTRQASEVRHQSFERTVQGLSQELQSTARRNQEAIKAQQTQFQQDLERQKRAFDRSLVGIQKELGTQREEYLRLARENKDEFQRKLQDQKRELQGAIQSLATTIETKEQNQRVLAERWISDASALLRHMESSYRHEKFRPGRVKSLQGLELQCRQNIEAGVYQAAIATGQSLYRESFELRAELEYAEREWEIYFNELQKSSREMLAECESLEDLTYAFGEGDFQQEIRAEVDYWTEGALRELIEKTKNEIEKRNQSRDTISLEDLQKWLSDNDQRRQELNVIVERARLTMLASQIRVNLASEFVEALESHGWALQEEAWEGEQIDGKGWKNSFHCKLKNLGGDEMVTIVIPTRTVAGTIENQVTFSYHPKNIKDGLFSKRQTSLIENLLHTSGLTNEPLRCLPGQERTLHGRSENLNFKKIRETTSSAEKTGAKR